MRFFFCCCLLCGCVACAFAQKMLLLERTNRDAPTKYFVGETLHFRLAGEEDYWYERTITDMMPESGLLFLDQMPVRVSEITALRVHRRPIWRIGGGLLFTFGATLALATTVGRFGYGDRDLRLGRLYGTSAAAGTAGWWLLKKRRLTLGEKHRLRLIEVKIGPLKAGNQ